MKMSFLTFLAVAATGLSAAATPAQDDFNWTQVNHWPAMMGGVWSWNRETLKTELLFGPNTPKPPILPAVREQYKDDIANPRGDTSCRPFGMPYMMVFTSNFGIFYSRNEILLLYRGSSQYRRIYLDGRTHQGAEPSFNGHSVGHWEGTTLVVDTAGIDPATNLVPGVPQGKGTRIVERFRMVEGDALDYRMTVENSKLQDGRWQIHRVFTRESRDDLMPDFCENNREEGGVLNLTPPPPYRPE